MGSQRCQVAIRALALNELLVEVVAALDEAGVRPLLIKGPAIANWLHGDPYERSYRDVDLIVDPSQFGVANTVLERLGFQGLHLGPASAERQHAHPWRWARDYAITSGWSICVARSC